MMRGLSAVALLLTAVGLAFVGSRIAHHARSEQVFEGPVRTFAEAREGALDLGAGSLEAGQAVVFEVCAGDAFPPDRWRDAVVLELWDATDGERIVESALDDARLTEARRAGGVGCIVVANAASLGVSGEYALVARALGGASSELSAVPLRGRIVAGRPTTTRDLVALLLLIAASIAWALLLAFARGRPPASGRERARDAEAPPRRRPFLRPDVRAGLAWLALAATLFGVGYFTGAGPFAALLGSVVLAGVQLAASFGLSSPGDREARLAVLALGLCTRRSRELAALAPLVGLALVVAGRYAGALVPATSESAIETFVASHSGYLAVAAAGVLLPLVEELFFRGLLYGLLERAWGGTAATVAVVLAFPVVHLPQVAGAWGALLSLAITGAGLTLLRRASGSVVPGAIAHLVHNAVIALMGFPLA